MSHPASQGCRTPPRVFSRIGPGYGVTSLLGMGIVTTWPKPRFLAQPMIDTALPLIVAWQGLTLRLPQGWEVAGTYGNWKSGHLLLARDRAPVLRVSWERRREPIDLDRTLAKAAKRVQRETGCQALPGQESAGPDGAVLRCQGRSSEIAVGARRFAEAGLTVVWRQLAPSSVAGLTAMVRASDAVGEDAPAAWCMHGLACTLPPWWRNEGVQALAGLTRAVWFRYPQGRRGADQVLVLRRLACASRVLAGRPLEAWLRTTLHANETATAEPNPGGVRLACTRPAANWWRRWRGRADGRQFHAWIDDAEDRVTVQEWVGGGEPLACLRQEPSSQGSELFNGRSSA